MNEEEEKVVIKYVTKIQKKITDPQAPQKKIIKYLGNLQSLPVTISILKSTNIAKTLKTFKKHEGILGNAANDLLKLWKSKFITDKDNKMKLEHKVKEAPEKKLEKESNLGGHSKQNRNDFSKNSIGKSKDPWRDVSLDFLGNEVSNKKKKSKLKAKDENSSKNHVEKYADKVFPRPKEKKHVIEVRRDVEMPSLPEIELPEIQRIYRPLHFSGIDDDIELSQRKKANVSEKELEVSLVSRKSRTQVFSGKRSCYSGALEDTGGVPYEILEPLLAKASPAQLIRLEEFNPYFTEDSGELWKKHCLREFRGSQPEDMESWRELYLRKCTERVEKLKSIQEKISQSQAQKEPARQAKLAYVAGPPKPSVQIRRKQLAHGTGGAVSEKNDKAANLKRELEDRRKLEAEHTIPFAKIPRRDRCSKESTNNLRTNVFTKKPEEIEKIHVYAVEQCQEHTLKLKHLCKKSPIVLVTVGHQGF
eukprot:gene8030-13940_t